MFDSYNREIDYLRISLIDSCNFQCKYCSPEDNEKMISKKKLSQIEVIEIVKLFSKLGIKKVRLTGGEPLLRNDLVEIVRGINKIEGIEEITLTSNGSLLVEKLEELKKAGLKRVNLSLDTFDNKKFKMITGVNKLDKVLESIKKLEELEMVPIKINCVIINKFNIDELKDFIYFTKNKNVQMRFIELMPMGTSLDWNEDKYYPTEKILEEFKELKFYKKQNIAKIYKLPDSKGEVGFISPNSNRFCDSCNRVRITSEGKLKLCLHSDVEYDLLDVLKQEKPLEVLRDIIIRKPLEHELNKKKYIKKNMISIGG